MTRPRDSTRARRICVDAHKWVGPLGRWFLTCHRCRSAIDLVRSPDGWRADHIRRFAEGGEDTAKNLLPICLACDAGIGGKAADDTSEVAKGKRVRDRHLGIRRRKGRPMAGTRASGWRHKVDGTWERR